MIDDNKSSKNKIVLVTGADGFLGRHLVQALMHDGYEVHQITRHDGDITRISFPQMDVSHVFHLAALTSVPNSWVNSLDYYRVNILGTANVLEYCAKSRTPLTFLSTYVYGQPVHNPIDENHPVNPNSPYALSKVMCEEVCAFYHKCFGVPVTIFRPFNIYGFGQNQTFLIPTIINQLLDNDVMKVALRDLTPSRDYIYVDDVIRALMLSIDGNTVIRTYNIASGCSYTVKEVYDIIQEVCGIHKPLINTDKKRHNEVELIVGSTDLIFNQLNFQPLTSFRLGIRLMLEKAHDRIFNSSRNGKCE